MREDKSRSLCSDGTEYNLPETQVDGNVDGGAVSDITLNLQGFFGNPF